MQILGICTDSTEEHADLDLHSFSCVAWGLQTHEVQPLEEMQSIQIINNLKMDGIGENPTTATTSTEETKPRKTILTRYPYLFPACFFHIIFRLLTFLRDLNLNLSEIGWGALGLVA